MRHCLIALTFVLACSGCASPAEKANPVVVIETSLGTIEAELFADKAPKTVANFLNYTKDKFYDDTIFHRVIPDFMIQGGGFNKDLKQKDTKAPIKNEADNGLKNAKGTLAMARLEDPDTASAEFYINTVDNRNLDHKNKTQAGYGYCVFGKVIKGMDVVEKIGAAKTHTRPGEIMGQRFPMQDVPVDTISIKSVTVKADAKE